ncbi:MAG: hotdog fold domain-containing protein [Pseudomonadota bacterium]
MAKTNVLATWQRLSGSGVGRWLFSRLVCAKAPYFASISPVFDVLEPGHAVAHFGKRRAVTNHIGTVHAIAMANLCELVAGTATEVTIPKSMRWIPRGMTIQYVEKANSRVSAEALLPEIREDHAQDIVVPVDVTDIDGNVVVRAGITMYVSPRQKRNSKD